MLRKGLSSLHEKDCPLCMNYRDGRVESRSKAAKRTVLFAWMNYRDRRVESRSKAAKRTVLSA
jgi:hypothetical protein